MKEKFKFLCCIALMLAALGACKKAADPLDTKSISDRLSVDEKVVEALLGQIRSVTVIPNLGDGSVMVSKVDTVFVFDVQPHSVIKEIIDSVGYDILDFDVMDVINFKSAPGRSLEINSAFIDGDGLLHVAVNPAGLGSDFLFCDGTAERESHKVALSACLKIKVGDLEIDSKYFNLTSVMNYFYFKSVKGGSVISMEMVTDESAEIPEIDLTYSTDKITWNPFVPGETEVTLKSAEDYVWFCSNNSDASNPPFSKDTNNFYRFVMKGGEAEAGGRIETLFLNSVALGESFRKSWDNPYKLTRLFENCTCLTSAAELTIDIPATEGICYAMFRGCTSLTESPYIDNCNSTLANMCYEKMFSGCTSLREIECYLTPYVDERTSVPEYCFKDWVSGVASDGVFVYEKHLAADKWQEGTNAVPTGWERLPGMKKTEWEK